MNRFFAFLLFVAVVYGFRLNFPIDMYYDEIYHVNTGRELLRGQGYHENTHPVLGKEVISLGIALFGDHSFSWRVGSLIFGVAGIGMVFLLGLALFQDEKVAWLAAVFYTLDCLSFTQARIAMLNAVFIFFVLASLWCFVQYWVAKVWNRRKAFCLSGLFLGLALATKWVSAFWAVTLGMLLLFDFARASDKKEYAAEAIVSFGFIPFLIYAITWFPFVWSDAPYRTWTDAVQLQKHMFNYHAYLTETHRYQSEWWSWPFLIRPIWYFFNRAGGQVYGIIAIGNPAVFGMIIPALVGLLVWGLKRKSTAALLVVFACLMQYFPYVFISRIKFLQHFQPTMPFVCLALGFFGALLWPKGRWGKIAVGFYLVLVVVGFVYWYPLLSGYPISERYFQHHLWFKSWI